MRRDLEITAEVREPGDLPDPSVAVNQQESPSAAMRVKRFYRVKAITDASGTHPAIPEGVNWVGNTDGEYYLIVTAYDLRGVPGVEELSEGEAARFLQNITDLDGDDCGVKWGVM